MTRAERAAELTVHRDEEWAPGLYLVQGGTEPHWVHLNDRECDCADFAWRGGPCKHWIALRRALTGETEEAA